MISEEKIRARIEELKNGIAFNLDAIKTSTYFSDHSHNLKQITAAKRELAILEWVLGEGKEVTNLNA